MWLGVAGEGNPCAADTAGLELYWRNGSHAAVVWPSANQIFNEPVPLLAPSTA